MFPVRFPGVPDQLPVRAVAQLPHLHRRPLALRLQRRFRLPSILGHTSPSVRGDQGKKSYYLNGTQTLTPPQPYTKVKGKKLTRLKTQKS